MAIPDYLLDALMKDYKNPEDLIGETGLPKKLTKQLLERAMQAEMTEHLGYKKNALRPSIPETAVTASESRGSSAISILPSPVIVTPASSRSFFPRARDASTTLMSRLLLFMPGE